VSTLATVSATSQSRARFHAKESGILSGLRIVELVFAMFDATIRVEWSKNDGDHVTAGEYFGEARGSSRSLLTAERLALNLLQRMGGIATATASLVSLIRATQSRSQLLDTRKTAPGLRLLDKLAVRHGGGVNHRVGLYDMVMIKDNHIAASGGIAEAVKQVRHFMNEHPEQRVPIEVETRTLEEVQLLLSVIASSSPQDAPIQRIMLDNMVKVKRDTNGKLMELDVSMLESAVKLLQQSDQGRRLESEASGNVTAETIATIAKTGVTYISVGAVTHSVKALDISLKIQES